MSQSNTILTDQESSWIHDVASRLRLLRADTAQLAPDKRAGFLQEELERHLDKVPPANRKRFVEALLARFPVAGQVVNSFAAPPPPAPAPAALAAPAPEAPEQTLTRLLAIIPQLSEEKRGDLARQLFESDFVRAYRSALELSISDKEQKKALGLEGDQQPRLERLVQLSVALLEVYSRLDQTALKTMEALAPRSPVLKRGENVRKAVARFLVGESDSVAPQLNETFSLIAALLVAPLSSGRSFGQWYLERFAPMAIEDVVASEGRIGVFGNKKEQCWNRYCDLARDFATADLVDRKIKECQAAVVQKTVEGSSPGRR